MAGHEILFVLLLWKILCNNGRNLTRRALMTRRRDRKRLFAALAVAAAVNAATTERMLGAYDRSQHWWERDVLQTFSDEKWMENFRMTKATFDYLCEKLQPRLSRRHTRFRIPVSVPKRVAVALWYLATGCDYRTLSNLFGVGKSSVCTFVHEVCKALVEVFKDRCIKLPKGDHLREVVSGFEEELNFPQCAGVIDGTHIPIIAPKEDHCDYFNRKGWHSVILQAVVDHSYRFLNINVGWAGSVHDARVLRNSTLFSMAEDGDLFPNDTRDILGTPVPLMLLGDPAYPLLPWLMKGYPESGQLTRDKRHFNYRLSRARIVVECAFGRLKGRWRCLLKRLDVDTSSVVNIVGAACILHNVCEMRGEDFDEGLMSHGDDLPAGPVANANHDTRPLEVREALTQLFAQQRNAAEGL
ncbi:uncharacterized protein [Branchiostoma lanceolatum]|uniref:uncharacterized protein n=1 Tax=Branchiostoma lanceolatum TaxID=7740 RepID=UPI0034556065